MDRDLTTGSPLKKILAFCLPLLIGNLFQQCYAIVDSIIVGHFLGVEAFAAIGSTSSLNLLVISFAVGLCSGLCIPIAQNYGAGNIKGLRKAEANALYIAGVATLLISVAMTLLSRPFLVLLKTPSNLLDDAVAYIGIIFAGSGGLILYNMVIGFLRALGDGKTPLFFLILASVLNILLDLLFILVFRMGVAGAGLATVVAQFLSSLLCIRMIRKNFPVLHFSREDAKPSLPVLKKLASVSLPIGLQFSITAVGSIMVQTAVNGLGSAAVAAMAVGGKVNTLLFAPMDAVGVALVIFISQNFGACRMDRVRLGVNQVLLTSLAYGLVCTAATFFLGGPLGQIYLTNTDAETQGMIVQFLKLNGLFFVPLIFIYIYRNTLQGIGYSNAAMGSGLAEMLARIAVALFLIPAAGFLGASLASPAAWFCASMFLIPMFLYAAKKQERKMAAAAVCQAPPKAGTAPVETLADPLLVPMVQQEGKQDLGEE